MPYEVYKLTHFLGIFVLLITLALPFMHRLRGGTHSDFPRRRALALTHGAASFLVLLGGFGMLARLGVVHTGLPSWILLKLTIWLALSAALALALRTTAGARTVLVAAPLLALLAAGIAIYKP
ncbi:MAG TPA: hypothetical protein VK912_19285 [Longimicrobiales bacterium]|nr:hypothetical protein [Longimicrobiales bacterium]